MKLLTPLVFTWIMIFAMIVLFSSKVFAQDIKHLDAVATVVKHDGSYHKEVKLIIKGMSVAPKRLFNVNVFKQSGFRSLFFNILDCKASLSDAMTIKPYTKPVIVKYGKDKTALGLYTNRIALPKNEITVIINDKDTIKGNWNHLDCFMK